VSHGDSTEARPGAPSAEARNAGRGIVSIAGAKLWFIVTGYAVQLVLPRLLGSPEAFGFYSTAMTDVSIVNNVLIAATVQTVSKKVSEDESRAGLALRQGLLLQAMWGGALGLALFLLAPFIAGTVKLNPTQAPLYRTAAVVVIAYALYAAIVGALNGRQRFAVQARLDMTFSTLRSGLILGAAALGFGALGAFAGFASAAALIFVVAFVVSRRAEGLRADGAGLHSPWGTWFAFMAPLWLYQACLNGILQVDVSILSRTAIEASLAAGTAAEEAARVGDRLGGFYRAAQTFAFVPYQLILSVTFVVFPLVAKATSGGDREAARATIRRALRFSLLVLLAFAAPMAGAAEGVIRLAYTAEYLPAAEALRVLVIGLVPFALFVIAATAVSGAGRPFVSAVIAGGALAVLVVAVRGLITLSGPGEGALVASALGTSIGAFVALVAIGIVSLRQFGAFIPPISVLRGLAAAAAGAGVAYAIPHGGMLMSLVALAAGFFAFGLALVVLRELAPAELRAARDALLRRKRAPKA
jgi:stage V sporulation protein B